jgi:hypothetical protein
MLVFFVCACTGINTDKISDELEYRPNLSVPIGQLHVQYEEVYDLPLDLPEPIDSRPVSWQQSEIIYFDVEASLSERKYILSMLMQFDISNEYPAVMEVELYLLGNFGATTVLTTEPIRLEAAEIDETGAVMKATTTSPYPYQLPLTDEQIDALLEAEQLVISSRVNDLVLSSEVVNSFPGYQLKAAVGVQAQIDFSINNN